MKAKIVLLSLALSLSSCMLLDLVKPSSGLSVDTSIVAGDQANANTANIGTETTSNTAEAITQTYNNINKQYPWWIVLLLIMGWVMPSPSVMWSNLLRLLGRK